MTWKEELHPRDPKTGEFIDLPTLPDLPFRATGWDVQERSGSDYHWRAPVLHGGEWKYRDQGTGVDRFRVQGDTSEPGPIPDRVIQAVPVYDWAAEASDQMARIQTGDGARLAAGAQYDDGDERLMRWVHEHPEVNDLARMHDQPDPVIDGLLAPSTAPMRVYRGADLAAMFPGHQGSLVGHEWTERSYLASSTSEAVAREYAKGHTGRPTVLELTLPKGTGTAAVGYEPDDMNSWEITDLFDSGEILVQRGLHLRVVSDTGAKGRLRRIGVEVVQ